MSTFAQVRAGNGRRTPRVRTGGPGCDRLCTTAVESHEPGPFVKAARHRHDTAPGSSEPIFVHGPVRANDLIRGSFRGSAPSCPQACAQGVHNAVACPPHEVPGYPHDLWITCSSWVAVVSDAAYVGPRCHHAGPEESLIEHCRWRHLPYEHACYWARSWTGRRGTWRESGRGDPAVRRRLDPRPGPHPAAGHGGRAVRARRDDAVARTRSPTSSRRCAAPTSTGRRTRDLRRDHRPVRARRAGRRGHRRRRARPSAASCCGSAVLTYLHDLLSSVPLAANAGFYADIVREKAILRRLVDASVRIAQMSYAGGGRGRRHRRPGPGRGVRGHRPPRQRGLQAAVGADAADPGRDGGHLLPRRQLAGVPTGFADLDELTNGLHPGQMVIVAARPGMREVDAGARPGPVGVDQARPVLGDLLAWR